jgi:Mg2+/Co2+ transporter CorB
LGNNLVNILATSLATALFTKLVGESSVAIATLVMTVLVLIFAEVLPKTYAITNAERAAARVSAPIALLVSIFDPIVSAIRKLVRGILWLFGVRTSADEPILAVREEIAGAISLGHLEGVVQKEDRDRILGALDLSERTVEEIMLHRSSIEMINFNDEPKEILAQCMSSNHTRLPVYKDEPENIIGVIHAKDLARFMYSKISGPDASLKKLLSLDISSVIMKPYFVPDTTALDEQMRQFLRRRTHFALVVDEYGSLEGMITLEDILEEIVGEIADEFDPASNELIKPDTDGIYELDGTMTIRDLNRAMDWNLPDEHANTLAGLVLHEAQMIPAVGQVFRFHGFRFEVAGRNANRITLLRVRPLQ